MTNLLHLQSGAQKGDQRATHFIPHLSERRKARLIVAFHLDRVIKALVDPWPLAWNIRARLSCIPSEGTTKSKILPANSSICFERRHEMSMPISEITLMAMGWTSAGDVPAE